MYKIINGSIVRLHKRGCVEMVYAVVGALCGVYGLFAVMVCCGSGKMKSKRDRDLEDREQLEFCRNFNKTQEKLKMEKEKNEKREGKC